MGLNPAGRVLPVGAADRRTLLVGGDIVVLSAVTLLALRIGAGRSGWEWSAGFVARHAFWPAILVTLWIGLAWANGLYDLRRAPDRWMAAILSAKVSAQLVVIWAVIYFLPPPWTLVRHVAVFYALGAAAVMPLWRQAYAAVFSRDTFRRRMFILGASRAGRLALEAARAAPHEFDPLGFVDDDPSLAGTVIDGVPVVADHTSLIAQAQALGATDLVLAVPRNLRGGLFAALMEARERGLVVTPMAVFYEQVTGRLPVEHIGDHWAVALPLDPADSRGLYRGLKRGSELLMGTLGLVVLALLLPFVAIALRLDSKGPVFYRQMRTGKGGEPFSLWKLRTMRVDAEAEGPQWADESDPRVTRVGRWLRRTRLDELPQAINVVRGEMSVVGPRPERPEFVGRLAQKIPFYRARHAVRPGVTGWAAIHQGYAGSEEEALIRLQYDLYYLKHQSVLLDAYILLRTVSTVLRLRGR